MATVNLGRVGFVNKGAYSATTTYKVQDIVTYASGVYVCIQTGVGHALTDSLYWAVWFLPPSGGYAPLASPTFTGTVTAPTFAGALTGNAASATKLVGATWTVQETAGVLYFQCNGVNKAKLDSSGNFIVLGNVSSTGGAAI